MRSCHSWRTNRRSLFAIVSRASSMFVACALLLPLAVGSFDMRPQLLGYIFLLATLILLERFRQGKQKSLWILPLVFLLWINTHGTFAFGFAVLGLYWASGLFDFKIGGIRAERWTGPQRWKLLGAAGASVAALFINPFGAPLVPYPFRIMFGPGTGVADVQEFASVHFHAPWGKVAMILILGVLLIAVFSEVRWRLDEVAMVMLALYYALTFSRFIFLAGILLPPIFATRLKLMEPYDRSSDKRLNNAIALLILLGLFVVSVPRPAALRSPVQYPRDAVAYMTTNGIQGRVFHEYVWGGYLIWHMPSLKVFVDGRYDPYGPNGVFKDYMAAISGEKSQAVLDKYRVDYVLMPADSVLVQILKETPKWTVRYSDRTSVLLQRSPAS